MPVTASGKYSSQVKSIYRYPLSYEDETQGGRDYLMLKIMEVNYPNSSTSSISIPYNSEAANAQNHKEITRIYLPIPQNLQDSNSLTWGEDRIGPLGAALYNFASTAIGNPDEMMKELQKLIQNPGSIGDKIGGITDEQKGAITSYMAAQAASQFSNVSPNAVIARSTGQVFQSNLELLFQGVNLRQFAFPFTFAPRNDKEADEIKEIIRVLKKHSSAKQNTTSTDKGKIFMKSPDVFELQFMQGNQEHPFLNQFKTCALTNLNFNYTGTGNYATYKRGEPVMINMTLAFKEIVPIYYEDYDEGKGLNGFGY